MAAHGCEGADADSTIDFGWEEADGSKSGRRRKLQRKFKPGTFETMGLSEAVLKGVRRAGYRLPTPIQRKAIPPILQGLDVVGMARTGSGKTAAFVLPLLQKLAAHSPKAPPRALLLSPTRELALQTARVVSDLGRATDLRVATLVGGDSLEAQFAELAAHPDVLVATPGRLLHHLDEIAAFSLQGVCYAVFDEADRLFEMGFADQLRDILSRLAGSRQTLLFSATMPAALAAFASAGLKAPELVRLDAESRLSPDLGLAFFTVRPEERSAALLFVLKYVLAPDAPTVVFAATKHAVELLVVLLRAEGIRALGVHGGLDQTGRTSALARFRSGRCPVLVVTDVAARGLDIPMLDNVVNYDFPAKPKLFVHRAGRAARAGRPGAAFSLLTRDELPFLLDLHLFLGRRLESAPARSLAEAAREALGRAGAPQPGKRPATLQPETVSASDASVLGSFPQAALEDEQNRVASLMDTEADLATLARPCANAHALYVRTRPQASPESARRARALPREGFHPLLAAAVPRGAGRGLEAHAGAADIAAALKAYRPAQTVLEAEVASAAKGRDGLLGGAMRAKRAAHDGTIAAAQHGRKKGPAGREAADGASGRGTGAAAMLCSPEAAEAFERHRKEDEQDRSGAEEAAAKPSPARDLAASRGARGKKPAGFLDVEVSDSDGEERASFRDPGFYVAYAPDSSTARDEQFMNQGEGRLGEAVLDLAGEDVAKSGRGGFHWDKRSKRYVQLQPSEKLLAGKRQREKPGVKKKDSKAKGFYANWSKRTRLSVGGASADGAQADAVAEQVKTRFARGGRGWVNPFKARGGDGERVGDELKTQEQVLKQRQVRQKRKDREEKRRSVNKARANRSGGKPTRSRK